jgi:precorrin-6B methylase 2
MSRPIRSMGIKAVLKNFVERTARTRLGWCFYRGCGRLSQYFGKVYGHARFVRATRDQDEKLARLVKELFPTLTVAHGPFQGMRYPAAESFGSMLLPKLLGSYESELHPTLEALLINDYTAIVDIGCAEGYYAVGLGLRFPAANVFAFDTSPKARQMCAEMAALNGLESRVHIGKFCDAEALKSLPLGEKALIISDCEGYENVLFNREIAAFLVQHDLIVEAHDFIDIETSPNLRRVFAQSHKVEIISSTDDIEKAHASQFAELDRYSTGERFTILGERRPGIMKWLVLTAQTQASATAQQMAKARGEGIA